MPKPPSDDELIREDRAIRLVRAFDEAASGYAVAVATRQRGVKGAARRYEKALRALLKELLGCDPTDEAVLAMSRLAGSGRKDAGAQPGCGDRAATGQGA